MASLLFFCGLVSICFLAVMSAPFSPKFIDLTYPYVENATLSWPTMTRYTQQRMHWGVFGNLSFVGYYKFETGEHVGTHMDAPVHFWKTGKTIEQLPLDDTVGDAVVINVTAKAETNPDYEVTVSDLEEWEKKHGRMPDNPIVLLHTGYGKFWPNWETYLGSKTWNDTTTLHYPGLHVDAAKWLVNEKKVKLFGVDTLSLDPGTALNFPAHLVFASNGVPGIENVANLHLLPPRGVEVFAAPMKMKGATGGPTRLFARIGNNKEVNGGTALTNLNSGIVTMFLVAIFTWFMF